MQTTDSKKSFFDPLYEPKPTLAENWALVEEALRSSMRQPHDEMLIHTMRVLYYRATGDMFRILARAGANVPQIRETVANGLLNELLAFFNANHVLGAMHTAMEKNLTAYNLATAPAASETRQ